ncbi:MAG: NUDIX domain-containing protein [Chloroflexota bacterium]
MNRTKKVIAYITRVGPLGWSELLVFEHRDYPGAGLQVPAGTVKDGEAVETAVLREATEETGLEKCRLMRKLAVYDWFNTSSGQINERHVFHLTAPDGTADEWTWVETGGGEVTELEGYVFCFRWVPLDSVIELAGNQGDFLDAIR